MLYTDPNLRIVHRRGNLFAVRLSAEFPPAALAEPDLCLLQSFMTGADPEQVAAAVANGGLDRFFDGRPPLAQVRNRIAQLAQAGTLSADSGVQGNGTAQSIAACPLAEPVAPTSGLRLSSHFVLQPGTNGFQVWSSSENRYLTLESDLVLLLCAFGQGNTVAEVMQQWGRLSNPEALNNAVAWLRGNGLLAPVIRLPAQKAVGSEETRVSASTAPDWKDLQPDGRIPVYFTPHMENHYPLALGMMHSAINAFDGGALLDKYQLIPITYLEPEAFLKGPYGKFGPGVWLFSNYMWCLDINLKISRSVKAHHAGNLCIHGGPSTPGYQQACTDFMEQNPSVDISVHGEGEVTIVEVLQCLENGEQGVVANHELMKQVHGLTFRGEDKKLTWTPPRDRLREPDSIPSPYLDGVFDSYQGRVEAAIIESNRGCPFGCTFCDWGSATRQKVRKFDLERVKQEIDWIGRRQTQVLWIADANYGLYDRDVELAQHIVDTKARFGYPREVVVNYTKNTNRRLIEIIRIFSAGGIISQGIISIQTTDETTLDVINRQNIKTEKYDELAEVFASANLPLSTDLMIGLPGITVEAWNKDLQRYFDADVSVKAYPTQLLPNSPMADPDYRQRYRIEVDENDFVVACHSFNQQQLAQMKAIYALFEMAEGFGLWRYVLRYLQWDRGLQALDVLNRLREVTRSEPGRYPLLTWVNRFFLTEKNVPGGWQAYYQAVASFLRDEFDVQMDSALETALQVNALVMPDDTLQYPRSEQLQHDFSSWFRQRKQGGKKPLADFPPAAFEVDDPDLMAHIDLDYQQYDSHQYFYELRSDIARPKSVSDVRDRAQVAA